MMRGISANLDRQILSPTLASLRYLHPPGDDDFGCLPTAIIKDYRVCNLTCGSLLWFFSSDYTDVFPGPMLVMADGRTTSGEKDEFLNCLNELAEGNELIPPNHKIGKASHLFSRIDDATIEKQMEKLKASDQAEAAPVEDTAAAASISSQSTSIKSVFHSISSSLTATMSSVAGKKPKAPRHAQVKSDFASAHGHAGARSPEPGETKILTAQRCTLDSNGNIVSAEPVRVVPNQYPSVLRGCSSLCISHVDSKGWSF